jgi:predicted RNase H-like nuclease
LALRRTLLDAAGLPAALLDARVKGVPADDHLDALAALVVARDILDGCAVPLPDSPERDAYGLPVVIWAPAVRDCR